MRFLVFLSGLFLAFACSLSTEQEMALNKTMSNMIEARNTGDGLSYLNYTHPAIVKHYKGLGDSILKLKFQEVPQDNRGIYEPEATYWGSGYVKEVKEKDSIIQAKVEIKLYQDHQPIDSVVTFYATSFGTETDWLFAEKKDYNSDYFPENHRLFKD